MNKTTMINKLIKKKSYNVGIKNPNYKNGRTLQNYYCIDCNRKISYNSKRCSKCHGGLTNGKNQYSKNR
jgi:hypothetical protein